MTMEDWRPEALRRITHLQRITSRKETFVASTMTGTMEHVPRVCHVTIRIMVDLYVKVVQKCVNKVVYPP